MAAKVGYTFLMGLSTTTITMSSEADTYEKKYLYDISTKHKARTTGIATESILIDLGAATQVQVCFIDGSNIVSGDTTFTLSAGTTTACSDYGPTALTKDTKSYLELDQTWRYWKIIATKASGSYIEFGRVELCTDLYTCVKNYQARRTTGSLSEFEDVLGREGQETSTFKYRAAIRNWRFLNISEAQRTTFEQTLGELEKCILYDDQDDVAYYGKIRGVATMEGSRTGLYNADLNFKESL